MRLGSRSIVNVTSEHPFSPAMSFSPVSAALLSVASAESNTTGWEASITTCGFPLDSRSLYSQVSNASNGLGELISLVPGTLRHKRVGWDQGYCPERCISCESYGFCTGDSRKWSLTDGQIPN